MLTDSPRVLLMIALCSLFLAPAVRAAGSGEAPPAVAFAGSQVVVSGVTAGGQVVLFSVAQEVDDYVPTFRRRDALLTDDDRDGSVVLDLGAEVPWRSIWVAVELGTGGAVVATPPEYPLRETGLADQGAGPAVRWGAAGAGQTVEVDRSWVEGLLVQPGLGAWHFTAGDGGQGDTDGAADGVTRVALDEVAAADPALPAAPAALRTGDLLFVIDPGSMALLRSKVPAAVTP